MDDCNHKPESYILVINNYGITAVILNWGQLFHQGTFDNVWKYFGHNWRGYTAVYWVEARDTGEHLQCTGLPPQQGVSSM